MRRFFVALMGFALCLAVTSCEPKTALSVSTSSLSFDNKGGSQTVTVSANKAWSVTPGQAWCKVSPTAGDGKTDNVTLSVSCDPNTTYDARSCAITVVCEELSATINVTQAEGTGLIVSQTEYRLTNEAQTVSIEVKANIDYQVSVESEASSWIQVQSTKGLNSHTIVLAVAENKDYDSRSGKVTVKDASGALSQTITVTQSESFGLFLTQPEYNLSNEAHTLTVEVKANVSFDVASGAEWIRYVETKGLKTSQIILEVAANDTYDAREGTVTVRQTGGALSGTITIRQDAAFGLFVTQTAYDLTPETQTIDVEVKYNVALEVVIPTDSRKWIELVGTKGLSERHYTFRIQQNEAYDSREGTITFKQKDGSLSGTVTVRQAEAPGLVIPTTTYSLSGEEQELAVEVQHNVPLEVTVPDSCQIWIEPVKTKGLTSDSFHFLVRKNETGKERRGTIQFKQQDGKLSKTVKVRQAAAEYILVDSTAYDISYSEQLLEVKVRSTRPFKVSAEPKDWIKVQTVDDEKAPVYILLLLVVANEGPAREGVVEVYTDHARQSFAVRQQAAYVNFADSLFKAYCLKEFDEDEDGEICFAEAKKAQVIDCSERGISSMKGIERFQNVRYINCEKNKLTSLDITGNVKLDSLQASDNLLTRLDISKNPLLRSITVDNNLLSSLNLRANALLEVVRVRNNQLSYIYFDKNPLVTELSLEGNCLTSLEVSDKRFLTSLDAHDNQLTYVNIANNPKLTFLALSDNQLAGIECKNCPALVSLLLQKNPLESIQLTGFPALRIFDGAETLLEEIDLSGNTSLEQVDLSNNEKLKVIWKGKKQQFKSFLYDKDKVEIKEK